MLLSHSVLLGILTQPTGCVDQWSQSRDMYKTIVICSLAAAVQCVHQPPMKLISELTPLVSGDGTKQARTERTSPFLKRLGSAPRPAIQMRRRMSGLLGLSILGEPLHGCSPGPRDSLLTRIYELAAPSPYIASSLVGCWLTDPLNHFFGRRGTLFWCGIFCTVSVIGQGLAQTWPQLFVGPFMHPP